MRKFILLLLVIIMPAWAGKYPVVTSITAEYVSGVSSPTLRFNFTQGIMEIGPASEVRFDPNVYRIMALAFRTCQNSDPHTCLVKVVAGGKATNGKDTIGTQALNSYNSGGKNTNQTVIPVSLISYGQSCLGYIASHGEAQGWSDFSGDVIAPAGCTYVPPASEWCKITTPEIVLDHGTITLANAEGHSVTAPLKTQCTTPMTVTFKLMTQEPYVYLDEGKSKISINDYPLNTPMDLPEGNSILTVKDMLSGVSTAGVHSGSSVLIMMPY